MKKYNETEQIELVNILNQDGVLCVPTDTVYGLITKINSEQSYQKIMKIKHRPIYKSLPVMCANIEQVKQIAIVDSNIEKIINHFMPGPITLVLNKKADAFANINNAGMKETKEIAIRLAPTKLLKDLTTTLNSPIFLTSANISKEDPCKDIDEVIQKLPNLDGYVVGNTMGNVASTILICTKEPYEIQRPGPISLNQILEVLDQ